MNIRIYEEQSGFTADAGLLKVNGKTAAEALGMLVLKAGLIPVDFGDGTRFKIPQTEMNGRQLELAGNIFKSKTDGEKRQAQLLWDVENPDLVPGE